MQNALIFMLTWFTGDCFIYVHTGGGLVKRGSDNGSDEVHLTDEGYELMNEVRHQCREEFSSIQCHSTKYPIPSRGDLPIDLSHSTHDSHCTRPRALNTHYPVETPSHSTIPIVRSHTTRPITRGLDTLYRPGFTQIHIQLYPENIDSDGFDSPPVHFQHVREGGGYSKFVTSYLLQVPSESVRGITDSPWP